MIFNKYTINNQYVKTEQAIALLFLIFLLVGCCFKPELTSSHLIVKSKDSKRFLKVSNETAASIGLETEVVENKKVSFNIKYNGIVKSVPSKTFYVSSPVNGRVSGVFVEPNQAVISNQNLAEISSQDIAELQFDVTKEQIDLEGSVQEAMLELSLAQNSYDREKKLYEDGITAKKEFLEAENNYKIAESKSAIFEKKKKSVDELAEKRLRILGSNTESAASNPGYVGIKSPLSGFILKRLINPGEVVEKDKVLFEASDLSEVLLESKIYEKDLPIISLGKKVTFITEALPGSVFHGEVNYVSQTVDPDTRTIAVRTKIQNPDYKLKPEMFGKMFISLSDKSSLVISKEAVQKVDNQDVVFVKTAFGFKEVKIKLGKESDGIIEVLAGLKPDQEIVTKGSFWLKSELHTD